MPQKTIFLSEKTIKEISALAEKSGKKFSGMCNSLIEKGLTYAYEQEKFLLLKKNQIEQRRILSRILNITSEIFLNSNKEKKHYKIDPKEILYHFKMQANKLVRDE